MTHLSVNFIRLLFKLLMFNKNRTVFSITLHGGLPFNGFIKQVVNACFNCNFYKVICTFGYIKLLQSLRFEECIVVS